MENISTISIELGIRRMKNAGNKARCFESLDKTFSDIAHKRDIPTQISEEIINFIETTNDNTLKLPPQKIAWVKEWAQIKTEERLPFVDLSLREAIQRHINRSLELNDGVISTSKTNANINFKKELITAIYNKCNGMQWERITIDNFIDLLSSNGKNQSLIIKKNETNRTKCVFSKIANCIENKDTRKTWIEDIKNNIFEGVDFTKASLQTNKYSAGYSETDMKFKPFLDSL